ncbi:MAG: spore coat associated protein CotJA [Clostridia bacterium]|nr:spore coat associated protein CotJA [Clostridia bacterium]
MSFDKTGDNDFQNPSSVPVLAGFPLAMAYVPYQKFEELNEPSKALECGTLFQALYKPFYGQRRRPLS